MPNSVQDIASADLSTLESALQDKKLAKYLQDACKNPDKVGTTKRPKPSTTTSESAEPPTKRQRQQTAPTGDGDSQASIEDLLELPVSTNETAMTKTVITTNRAPLVMAFATELLRFTMPEQPLSSRLSLAQAVVSANSQSKAVSEDGGRDDGQPRIRIMGREVSVLKRGGYIVPETPPCSAADTGAPQTNPLLQTQPPTLPKPADKEPPQWTTSDTISFKSSQFVARAITLTDPRSAKQLIRDLISSTPNLSTASHNAWAYSFTTPFGLQQPSSFDDGEKGAGSFILSLLRQSSAPSALVVLSRWYGGVMLGPDRWKLMRQCVTQALGQLNRVAPLQASLGGIALWGLDLDGMRSAHSSTVSAGQSSGPSQGVFGGMKSHRPETARNYLFKSFAPPPPKSTTKSPTRGKGQKAAGTMTVATDQDEEHPLSLLLGALRLLFTSWAPHVSSKEHLDRLASEWYVAVRPNIEAGPSGWGAKGTLSLDHILSLRRS